MIEGAQGTYDVLLPIEDISWEISDGEDGALFKFTNNSPYTIKYLSVSFGQKKDITEAKMEEFYTSLKEQGVSEDDITDVREHGVSTYGSSTATDRESGRCCEAGKSISEQPYSFRDALMGTRVQNTKIHDLVEPTYIIVDYV